MLDILPNESMLTKFTDTINEQIPVVADEPVFKSDLTVEDIDNLNQIMNEIAELNQTPPASGGLSRSLSRMDSISLALNDFFLQEFDAFESNFQMNDPMIGNSLLVANPLKIF